MRKVYAILVMLAAVLPAFAQINPQAPLQRDPAIKYGQLKNGMTYYIRHNENPPQRAEYYLFTDVGAIQETEAQKGLAHFLEHMCLNGTKNLPDKLLISYFQSIGASFGGNINASTGVEQTMYMLNNIPTTRQGIIDTCLLVLHDYAGFVTNDPVEIDKERGVIIEEWRTRRTSDWRMFEQQLKYLYKDSKYADCNIIGTKENLETFPPEELVKFYKTWYRPDNQAVVIVGDVDPDAIYNQLEELFADIPAAVDPQPKEEIKVPDNEEPIIGIITDKEATQTTMALYLKSEPLPKEYMGYGIGYMQNLLESMVANLFAERIDDIISKSDAPFQNAGIYFARPAKTLEVLALEMASREGEALSGFEALLTEFEKAKRYGFTDEEVERAKTIILTGCRNAVASAATRKNAQLVNDCSNDFYNGATALSPEYELQQAEFYLSMFNAQVVNQALAGISFDANAVVLYSAPDKEGLEHPTEEAIKAVMSKVQTAEIQANEMEVLPESLFDASRLKGAKVRKAQPYAFDSEIWTLKNGLRVIVRPADIKKDEVLLSISIDGGRSVIPVEDLPSVDQNILSYFSLAGVGEYPQSLLNKMLAGKSVAVSPFIDNITHGVQGRSTTADVETMLQLAYLYFAQPRFSQDEFNTIMNQLRAVLPNIVTTPDYALSKAMYETAFSSPYRSYISLDMLDRMNLASLERSYRMLFSNLSGACVTICGDFDKDQMRPLVEKYLGSLPVARKSNEVIDHDTEVVPGQVINTFEVAMETPKTSVLLIASAMTDYTLENVCKMDAINYVLDLIYTETIREEEGATYGVGTSCSITSRPKNQAIILAQFDTDPDRAQKMIEMAVDGIRQIAEQGPREDQLAKARENMLKNIPENKLSNSYWSSVLTRYNVLGVDHVSGLEAAVNALTVESVRDFAAQLLSQNNMVKIVMNPVK